jgi:hypothetical protein
VAEKVFHFVVESSGQEAQVVHGVFPTEAEAVGLAEALMADFAALGRHDSPLGWGCQGLLTVRRWCGTWADEVREWRNTDPYTADGRWVTDEEYDRTREEE